MKRNLIITFIICLFIGSFGFSIFGAKNISKHDIKPQLAFNNKGIEIENLLDKNLFLILIFPHVEKAIEEYYSDYFTYTPTEDPWSYKFLSIEKLPKSNYSYIIKLEVIPYLGPHLSVGVDHITFKIDFRGVNVENYEHTESHELPPHYQSIIKNKKLSTNLYISK